MDAKNANDKVYLAMHVPPGFDAYAVANHKKNLTLEKHVNKATDDMNKYKDKIQEIQEKRKSDHDDTVSKNLNLLLINKIID